MRITAVACVLTAGLMQACGALEPRVATGCSPTFGHGPTGSAFDKIWFTESGDRLVVEGDVGVAIWETANWKTIRPCPLRHPARVEAVSADARSIATRVWGQGQTFTFEVGPIEGPFTTVIPAAADGLRVSLVGFNSDATVLAAIRFKNYGEQTLELWKIGGTGRPWTKALSPDRGARAWSKDRRFLAIYSPPSILVVDTVRAEVTTEIPVTRFVKGVLFSPDATRLAVGLGEAVVVYDAKDGREIFRVTIPNTRWGLYPIAFGASLVVSDLDWTFAAFDAATGAMQSSFPLKSMRTAASGDSALLVLYPEGDYNLVLFDAPSGHKVSALSPIHTYGDWPVITAMAISPAKDLVVVGTTGGDLRTWSFTGKGSTILQTRQN